jgi:hypothetical protein
VATPSPTPALPVNPPGTAQVTAPPNSASNSTPTPNGHAAPVAVVVTATGAVTPSPIPEPIIKLEPVEPTDLQAGEPSASRSPDAKPDVLAELEPLEPLPGLLRRKRKLEAVGLTTEEINEAELRRQR